MNLQKIVDGLKTRRIQDGPGAGKKIDFYANLWVRVDLSANPKVSFYQEPEIFDGRLESYEFSENIDPEAFFTNFRIEIDPEWVESTLAMPLSEGFEVDSNEPMLGTKADLYFDRVDLTAWFTPRGNVTTRVESGDTYDLTQEGYFDFHVGYVESSNRPELEEGTKVVGVWQESSWTQIFKVYADATPEFEDFYVQTYESDDYDDFEDSVKRGKKRDARFQNDPAINDPSPLDDFEKAESYYLTNLDSEVQDVVSWGEYEEFLHNAYFTTIDKALEPILNTVDEEVYEAVAWAIQKDLNKIG